MTRASEVITSVRQARDAGLPLASNGYSNMRRGTIRVVHVYYEYRDQPNHTACNRRLSEPSLIGSREFLGQYRFCEACQRKVNA